jgi:bile salt-stimulated lipase
MGVNGGTFGQDEKAGCPTRDVEEMVDCLKTRPARQIVASVKKFQPWLYIPFSPFGIVVDSWSPDPVLPDHPYNLLKTKQLYDVPWMVSYTNAEGLYPADEFYGDEEYLKDIDTRWNELIPLILDYNYTVELRLHDEVSQKIRQHFLGEKKLSRTTFRDFLPILSERLFTVGIQKAAMLQASATKSPVYSYQFAHHGGHSWFEYTSEVDNRDFGASHADDVPYIFKIKAVNTNGTEDDRKMVKLMVELITSFTKTGYENFVQFQMIFHDCLYRKPNVNVEWTAVSKTNPDFLTHLKIHSPEMLSLEMEPLEMMEFWDSLPIKENEKLFVEEKEEL